MRGRRVAVMFAPIRWIPSLPAWHAEVNTGRRIDAALWFRSAVVQVRGTAMTVDAGTISKLTATITGRIIAPDDADYNEARRVWNGMIDKRPRLIVKAASAADVAPTIALARDTGLPLAIRGGGHNVAGNGTVNDGILLDLGRLHAVEVDPDARLVRVEAGAP